MRRGLDWYKREPRALIDGNRAAKMSTRTWAIFDLLLDLIYEGGGLTPDDPAYIAGHFPDIGTAVARREIEHLASLGKIYREGPFLTNKRAKNQAKTRQNLSETRAKIGQKGGISSGFSRSPANENNNIAEANASSKKQAEKRERREESSDTNVSGGKPPPDPVKVMFNSGVSLMGEAGVSERQARSLLGKWKAQHGVEAVLSVLGRAQREGAIDPVAFCEGCFRQKPKTRHHQDGDRMEYDDAFGGGPLVR